MVDILLPIYNGEKFLRDQLDSILLQSYYDWRVIARDDGSSDDSVKIVKDYVYKYPDHFSILEDEQGNLGTSGSIKLLARFVSSDYFMFCDQDDIWENNKIEITMREMKKIEKENPDVPLLVCSDACCINEYGRILCPSFFSNQKFVDTTADVHQMLALNIVQGSTALMNKQVLNVIKRMPEGLYHDWWTAVNVVYYGKVSYIHQPLLRYRQHHSNVVGALNVGPRYLIKKLSHVKEQMNIYILMYKSLRFKVSIVKWVYYKLLINLRRF